MCAKAAIRGDGEKEKAGNFQSQNFFVKGCSSELVRARSFFWVGRWEFWACEARLVGDCRPLCEGPDAPGSRQARAPLLCHRGSRGSQRGSMLERRALLHVSPKRRPLPACWLLKLAQAPPSSSSATPPSHQSKQGPQSSRLSSNPFATTSLLLLLAAHSCALPPASPRALLRCQGHLLLPSPFLLLFFKFLSRSLGFFTICAFATCRTTSLEVRLPAR